ncbi:uncharacterized protein LOC124673707 isoform X2 [Lolium rigidum]|uniref:uncharacterized protein LOC124673707 isoform X2 n=1 Tax=Lolium rigidum TaxID=89674 RepID=UPI001F5E1602|nr:uncharacterized protein LOC124673707 isoform X2 [Lolium rigidum]
MASQGADTGRRFCGGERWPGREARVCSRQRRRRPRDPPTRTRTRRRRPCPALLAPGSRVLSMKENNRTEEVLRTKVVGVEDSNTGWLQRTSQAAQVLGRCALLECPPTEVLCGSSKQFVPCAQPNAHVVADVAMPGVNEFHTVSLKFVEIASQGRRSGSMLSTNSCPVVCMEVQFLFQSPVRLSKSGAECEAGSMSYGVRSITNRDAEGAWRSQSQPKKAMTTTTHLATLRVRRCDLSVLRARSFNLDLC